MKFPLLIAIFLSIFSQYSFAQVVWPGDVNNNGIVNEIDLLFLGYAFGETGSPRAIVSSEWAGQEAPIQWENSYPDGLNFSFADCNGDGIVDDQDAEVIKSNLTNIHDDVPFIKDDILEAIPGVDVGFGFKDDTIQVAPGDSGEFEINLASDIRLSDITGVAFTINYDSRFYEENSVEFQLKGDAWIEPFDSRNLSLINESTNQITFATTVVEGLPASGGGFIGTVSFVIIEDAIDLLQTNDTVTIAIDSITVIKDDFEKVPVAGATGVIEIEGRTTNTYDPILNEIKLYPNPNNGWALLQTNEIEVESIRIINTLGQVVFEQDLARQSFHSLDLQNLQKGFHWLQMITKHGIKSIPLERL